MITPAMEHRTGHAGPLVRYPVASYFVLAFGISWLGALAVVSPHLLRHEPVPKFTGLMMFPVMLLGPSFGGILMTWLSNGREGVRDLAGSMRCVNFPARWYAILLLPATLILIVLTVLRAEVLPVFTPNHFYAGASFGIIAGFLEEIGWMGYAFSMMARRHNALFSAMVLGVLWSIWHLPVVDYLGTATPHGEFWLRYFLAFMAAMIAMRIVIAWVYTNTKSVLLCQLLHAASTGALVVLSPARVNAAQEAGWYFAYATLLWIVVAVIVLACGSELRLHRSAALAAQRAS